jgi:hypothetical protein
MKEKKTLKMDIVSTQSPWWFDGARYWVQNQDKEWQSLDRTSFTSYLQKNPYRIYCSYKEDGMALSEVDEEKLNTELHNRVQYAGALAGWKKGVVYFEDSRALITKSPTLIEPKEGDFPNILAYMGGLFRSDPEQVQYVMWWIKDTLDALYAGRPRQGMALVLAGEAGCGKTLFKEFLKVLFGGGEVYPYAYMMGKDSFNEELTQAPLWVVDDEAADTTLSARIKFGAEIKKVVANSAMRCRGMHQTAITLNPLRRLVICVNVEPDRLLVLPPIDDDIADKMLITKCVQPCPWPMPMSQQEEKDLFFQKLIEEMPAFIHWLHVEHEHIPIEYRGRFGVRHYHNPEISESLLEISPEMQLAEQVDRVLFKKSVLPSAPWTGTCNELVKLMKSDDSPLQAWERAKVPAAAWIGRRIAKLSARFPDRYEWKKNKIDNTWTIKPMDFGNE